ncbi:hypothetical protein WDW89_21285 [Deltaproteobacteria bacterium TL4]
MIEAAKDFMVSQGRDDVWDVWFQTTIPSGSETCHFEIETGGNPDSIRKWEEYTHLMEDKALEIAKQEDRSHR